MKPRIMHLIRIRSLLVAVSMVVVSCLQASGSSFSFYAKAQSYYKSEWLAGYRKNPENKAIDSALINPGKEVDFNKAFSVSWKVGLFLLEQGKHPQALDIFSDIRSYLEAKPSKTQDDQKRISSVYNIIGAIYEETGLWNEALDLYMNSLQICNVNDFKAGKAKVFNNIGKLYFNRNELGKAENLFLKAIEINKSLDIRSELFNNYNNLAGIYKQRKDLKRALDYALIAMNQLDIHKDFYDLSILYSNIGNLYQDMGNISVALSYYQQAADIQGSKSFLGALIRSSLSISSVYEALHDDVSAGIYIAKSLKLAREMGNPSQNLIVLESAARYYRKSGDFKLSSGYYAEYVKLNDSLEALNSLTKIEQIQAVYEVINKEKNNQILQQKINLQQLAIQHQRIIMVASLVLFIFLAYFLINLLRTRKRERLRNEFIVSKTELLHTREKELMLDKEHSLNLQLDYKNRQLTSYALNMARTNEFIVKTSEELNQILLSLSVRDKERTQRIRNLLATLHQYSSGNSWEEFRLYFQEVHQSFEKNLGAAFPDLSSNDKKICALLKLGLSTKDIANLTFREIRSVESARNRLRKKLNLPAEVNIINFLSQF